MNRQKTAAKAVIFATAFAAASVTTIDGRSSRSDVISLHSTTECQWKIVLALPELFSGWFKTNLRCSFETFNHIVEIVERNWTEVNRPLGNNTVFFIKDRVAVTLNYLGHPGSIVNSKNLFGMGKTSALRFIWEVIAVLSGPVLIEVIQLPSTMAQWESVAAGFAERGGFPNVAGAMDGSLIEIERPEEHDGWYCRKGYPAINLLAVVNHRGSFIYYSMRPGSCSDKLVLNMSSFGINLLPTIPLGFSWLGDAGYQLTKYVMTPYDLGPNITRSQRLYNYIHSKTRITIECAFGRLKQRFRVLRVPLNFSTMQRNARVIECCLVLHNIMTELNDDADSDDEIQAQAPSNLTQVTANDYAPATEAGKAKRDAIMNLLYSNNN